MNYKTRYNKKVYNYINDLFDKKIINNNQKNILINHLIYYDDINTVLKSTHKTKIFTPLL